MRDIGWIGRRELMRLLGIGGASLAAGLPDRVHAATPEQLVLGLDISDAISLDPARGAIHPAANPERHHGALSR